MERVKGGHSKSGLLSGISSATHTVEPYVLRAADKLKPVIASAGDKLHDAAGATQEAIKSASATVHEAGGQLNPMIKNAGEQIFTASGSLKPLLRNAIAALKRGLEPSNLDACLGGYFTCVEFALATFDAVICMHIRLWYAIVSLLVVQLAPLRADCDDRMTSVALDKAHRAKPTTVAAAGLTHERFAREFVAPQRACIITGGAATFPSKRWTVEAVAAAAGASMGGATSPVGASASGSIGTTESAAAARGAGGSGADAPARRPLKGDTARAAGDATKATSINATNASVAAAAAAIAASAEAPLSNDGTTFGAPAPTVAAPAVTTLHAQLALIFRQADTVGAPPGVVLWRVLVASLVGLVLLPCVVATTPVAVLVVTLLAVDQLRSRWGGHNTRPKSPSTSPGVPDLPSPPTPSNIIRRAVVALAPPSLPCGADGDATAAAAHDALPWVRPRWAPPPASLVADGSLVARAAAYAARAARAAGCGASEAALERIAGGGAARGALPEDLEVRAWGRGAVSRLAAARWRSHTVVACVSGEVRGVMVAPAGLRLLRGATTGDPAAPLALLNGVTWDRLGAGTDGGAGGGRRSFFEQVSLLSSASKDSAESAYAFVLRAGDALFVPAHYAVESQCTAPTVTVAWQVSGDVLHGVLSTIQLCVGGPMGPLAVRRDSDKRGPVAAGGTARDRAGTAEASRRSRAAGAVA